MSAMSTRWDALLGIAIGKATALWAIAGAYTLSANCVLAQITPDATLPNNSIVNINGNTFNITGGTQAGTNLFHSFQQFSVGTGSQAFFDNTVDIQNIISRVTGGSISNIDGLIRTLGTANLFLINPNGIVFGPNAQLNIGGSFFASTASSLKFADGTEFRTDGTQTTPLLTISVPLGLQFGQNPGKIQVIGDGQGTRLTTDLIDTPNALRLGANQILGLVGADLELLGGTLKSTGGRIELGSVGSDSLLGLVPVANGWTLDYGGVQNFRDIQLLQGATVDASGIGGGNVRVQGRQITLKQGSEIEASTLGFQSGGTLEVTGIESIQLDGSEGTYLTGLFTRVYKGANGNGGNIILSTGSVSLTDGAVLSASTFGQGDAGSISVQAKDSVSAAGNSYIFSNVASGAVGNGGDVNINAATLSLFDGAQLLTSVRAASNNLPAGRGQAGNVNVNVTGAVTIAGVKNGFPSGILSYLGRGAIGKGGSINITSGSFSLTDGAEVIASTFGQGDAGSVFVQAKDSVSVAGNSSIFSTVENGAVGKGGDVNINAATLSLKDGAQLLTSVRDASGNQPARQGQAGNVNVNVTGAVTIAGVKNGFPSAIFSELGSGAIGKGGNINITSGSVSLTDGAGVIASTFGQGDAGSIFVQAKDSVSAADSTIFSIVASGAVGKGGDVNINAATLSLKDSAQLSTSVRGASGNQPARQGQAGNVNVNVTGAVTIAGVKDGFSSGIFNSLGSGAIGKGGNINVTSGSVSLTDGAQLSASTFGQGDAGKIQINATDWVSVSGTSEITNPSAPTGLFVRSQSSGAAGDIEVTAPQIRLDNLARFNAESASGNGDNINLRVGDLLLLRRGSFISATAGTDKLGGNGGNITINARSGFIVSAPNENSDITANAFNGTGGRIDINSLGIFNFTQRSREDLVRELGTDNPNELNPQDLPTNDITAFSLTNPTLGGQITINTPDADQSLGLVELPIVLTDTSTFIANAGCDAIAATDSDTDKSKFTITGRGGLPPNPYEPLSTDVVWLDTRIAEITTQQQRSEGSAAKPPSKSNVVKIVPATGWVFDGKGNVTLISNASNANSLEATPAKCGKQ